MPFCPKCKYEYREGFTVCSECKCELVDSLEEEKETSIEEEKVIDFTQDFFDESEDEGKIVLTEEEMKEAIARARANYKSSVYVDNESKANDNKSSAWTFLIVGVAGLIAMALIMTGVIPLHLNPNTKYLIYGVLLAMFALFVVIGIVSMKNFIRFSHEATSEKSLFNEMTDFCKENVKSEDVDKALDVDFENVSSEELYFKRTERLKYIISNKFINLDEAFLDNFIDNIYSEIFEEN